MIIATGSPTGGNRSKMKQCTNNQCNRQIPDAAKHCPYCGQDQAKTRPHAQPFLLIGITMLAAMIILLVMAFSPEATFPNIAVNTSTKDATSITSPAQPATSTMVFAAHTSNPATPTATIFTRTPRTPTSTQISTSTTCPGAPPPRIQINDLVKVVTTDRDRLVLRSSPEINSRTELQRLNTGTQLKIFDGPVCVLDPETSIYYWFWEVKLKSTGALGWVAEGDRSLYFLEFIR